MWLIDPQGFGSPVDRARCCTLPPLADLDLREIETRPPQLKMEQIAALFGGSVLPMVRCIVTRGDVRKGMSARLTTPGEAGGGGGRAAEGQESPVSAYFRRTPTANAEGYRIESEGGIGKKTHRPRTLGGLAREKK